MSKYTSEVRYICENYAGLDVSAGYNSTNNVIKTARTKVFDFEYPIFDEAYRPVLETKILKHFYTREIGAESVGLWKLWLDARLNEIMPFYNKLYESELLEFNPFYDVDLTRDHISDTVGEEKGNREYSENTKVDSSNNNNGSVGDDNDAWSMYSDTPQGGLTGIADNTYLTNATHNTVNNDRSYHDENVGESETDRSGNDKNVNNITSTESYLEHVKGKTGSGSFSNMLKEYRQTFLNIDMQVINDLNDLFMNLW